MGSGVAQDLNSVCCRHLRALIKVWPLKLRHCARMASTLANLQKRGIWPRPLISAIPKPRERPTSRLRRAAPQRIAALHVRAASHAGI
jgi:hypothetical protein